MSQESIACPQCNSEDVSLNGHMRHEKQNHKCRGCGHQFVLNPLWHALSQPEKEMRERLLLERISLAGIARVMQLSKDCVQRYVNRQAEIIS